ncbi:MULTISPECIES: purine/pyrimidine permease [Bacillus]|uniref:Purine permease n=1 Tax=Bacillus pseudomycoides TaxID=64104 RepID=A0AAJ3R8I6_9BACI|nr:purine/pyrimidine permease [Bacillus pseudomycoides]EEM03016.1 Xanthine/uracil/vitamin C permease [Bacillus pseudomycoides]KFN09272.1 permease family protein [Bacillus pseudomycoides]MBD5795456.1 purine permease [Bacillus pseudomycoides]MDR4188764.1 purine permease [Bacillus pseudomycoides]MDR4327858.1 purine permease [Bacillus pseudomycoides]
MKTFLSALQWALFILAGSLIVPISVAASYGLEGAEAIAFVQRTLFVLGFAGLLQAIFGHRLPIQEGPAGLWWGIFSLYASLGVVLFGSNNETLRVLQYAFLLSGIICIILSIFGLIDKLVRYFTPTVIGTYLFLLVAQLSGSFLKGMFGLDGQHTEVQANVFILSLIVILLSFFIMKLPIIGQYSVLFSIVFGWILFACFGLSNPVTPVTDIIRLPSLFVFGLPRIEWNMAITVVFVTLLLLTNMLASIRVVQKVVSKYEEGAVQNRFKHAGIITGINQLLGGLFSAIGPVAISGSAGFIATTNIYKRLPFLLGSSFIIIISIFPKITSFFAAIPVAVGYAAIYPVFASMIGLAFREYDTVENKERLFRVAGLSLFTGIGVMFVPPQAFSTLPPFLASFLSNGLVLGSIMAILLEVLFSRSKEKQPS